MREYEVIGSRLAFALLLALTGSGLLGFNIFYVIFSWWTVKLSLVVFSLLHGPVISLGNVFIVGGKVIELIPACVAASAYLLLALLIVLTRGISFKKGITLFFVGSVLILLANVIRIEVLVTLLLGKGVNYFEQLHLLFWKVLASVYVAGVWILLCKWFHIKEIPVYSDVNFLLRQFKRS